MVDCEPVQFTIWMEIQTEMAIMIGEGVEGVFGVFFLKGTSERQLFTVATELVKK